MHGQQNVRILRCFYDNGEEHECYNILTILVKGINFNSPFTTSVTVQKAHYNCALCSFRLKEQWAPSYSETLPPQMMFVMVTGDHLILGTRRIAFCGLIATCVTSPVTLTLHFYPPYLPYWQIPCYTVSYLVLCTLMCTFSNMFRSLFGAATLLNSCFKVRNSRNFIYEKFHRNMRASII